MASKKAKRRQFKIGDRAIFQKGYDYDDPSIGLIRQELSLKQLGDAFKMGKIIGKMWENKVWYYELEIRMVKYDYHKKVIKEYWQNIKYYCQAKDLLTEKEAWAIALKEKADSLYGEIQALKAALKMNRADARNIEKRLKRLRKFAKAYRAM
ncbi:MAG: hypothetical protein PHC97_01530 [Patescibacteria group bacterium]|nr:hypothetical protein [Patescibacteria group bacterium]